MKNKAPDKFASSISCCPENYEKNKKDGNKKIDADGCDVRRMTVALAGNANVGKSVIFNQLTDSNQIIGNWPGKTVERAEGKLCFKGRDITIVDLPGIYSMSTYSTEEIVTRQYIAEEKPDAIINVVDAVLLERNLFLTVQLIELGAPIILCVNQIDEAKKKGIKIDVEKLSLDLGIPVIPTIAISGVGVDKLISTALEMADGKGARDRGGERTAVSPKYGPEIEKRIAKLAGLIESKRFKTEYAARWLAVKLLEGDEEVAKMFGKDYEEIINASKILADEIEHIHKEPCYSVLASERYAFIVGVVRDAVSHEKSEIAPTLSEKIDALTTHKVFGYVIALGVCFGLLFWTFVAGSLLSGFLTALLGRIEPLDPKVSGDILAVIWNGAFGGFVAGITLVVPFVLPFYFILAMIEDSGYLTRLAFMLDSVMHKIGLHGKAVIPLLLAYGCNVPAIYGCRIMETKRQKLLVSFAIMLIPCTARTVVIFGLVAMFVNIWWALSLYAIGILLILVLGRIAYKVVPGESPGLIMEMHPYKIPSLEVVSKQTWARTKSLIYIVFPIYIVGSVLVQVLFAAGALDPINNVMNIITVDWLGLPKITGALLVFGIVRKEFVIVLLASMLGTTNFAVTFTYAHQFIVLALVSMIYVPCLSAVAALIKEHGWKPAMAITLFQLAFAVFLGGIAYRLLALAGI